LCVKLVIYKNYYEELVALCSTVKVTLSL